MLFGSSRLLTPDEADATGGPEPTQTATQTDAGTADPASQPAPVTSPEQREGMASIDQQKLAQLTSKAAGIDRTFTTLQGLGYKSFDDAFAALGDYGKLKSDPTALSVMEALARPIESETQDVGAEPLTLEAITGLLDQREAAKTQAQTEQAYNSARETESTLVAEALGGERFGDTFKDSSFETVRDDGSTSLQNTLATLFERELEVLGDRQGEYVMPISDPARIKQATDNVFEKLKALNAWLLVRASQPGGGLDRPSNAGVVVDEGTGADDLSEDEKLAAQAQSIFDAEFKRQATGGQPASQQF